MPSPRINPPYDTGKVKIGLLYIPPAPVNDRHMDRVQTALLAPAPSIVRANRLEWWHIIADGLLYVAGLSLLGIIIASPKLFANFFGA